MHCIKKTRDSVLFGNIGREEDVKEELIEALNKVPSRTTHTHINTLNGEVMT